MMMDGVIDVITGAEVTAIQPLMNGLDTPRFNAFRAVNRVRYAGEWVCAVVAETRAIAEDARKNYHRRYSQPFVLDFCLPAHQCIGTWQQYTSRSEICFTGTVGEDFVNAEHNLSFSVIWGQFRCDRDLWRHRRMEWMG